MPETKQIKILIIDDEESLRTLLQAVFNMDSRFSVSEAKDGDEAMAMINTDKPDIILLDVMMPGQSGFEVCQKIKKNEALCDIKIIMLTAKGQDSDRDWAKSVGADHFLTKPFSPTELLEIVNQLEL